MLFAFDLLELKGKDWRSRQLAERKKRLASLLARASGAMQLTEHLDDDGELVVTIYTWCPRRETRLALTV